MSRTLLHSLTHSPKKSNSLIPQSSFSFAAATRRKILRDSHLILDLRFRFDEVCFSTHPFYCRFLIIPPFFHLTLARFC